jgi:hypothetical protein
MDSRGALRQWRVLYKVWYCLILYFYKKIPYNLYSTKCIFITKSKKTRKVSEMHHHFILFRITSFDYDGLVLLFSYDHSHVACFDITG